MMIESLVRTCVCKKLVEKIRLVSHASAQSLYNWCAAWILWKKTSCIIVHNFSSNFCFIQSIVHLNNYAIPLNLIHLHLSFWFIYFYHSFYKSHIHLFGETDLIVFACMCLCFNYVPIKNNNVHCAPRWKKKNFFSRSIFFLFKSELCLSC